MCIESKCFVFLAVQTDGMSERGKVKISAEPTDRLIAAGASNFENFAQAPP